MWPTKEMIWELVGTAVLLWAAITLDARWASVICGVLAGMGFGMNLVEYKFLLRDEVKRLEAQVRAAKGSR